LLGSAIKGGSSHYVVTGYDGRPSATPTFDEIVIANEFSIAPAFIITISNKVKKNLIKEYQNEAQIDFQKQNQQKTEKKHQIPKTIDGTGSEVESEGSITSSLELSHIAVLTDFDSESDENLDEPLIGTRIPLNFDGRDRFLDF
jgi:hypothetical protein